MNKRMERKIALMIIYNHRYDNNIEKLERLYSGKFSHIFHVMPFYDGKKENVIPVYENSFFFSGYIAQAYQHVKNMGYTHFFWVADDMLLNPLIDETTLFDELGIEESDSYISTLQSLESFKRLWFPLRFVFFYDYGYEGVHSEHELMTAREAFEIFEQKGFHSSFIIGSTYLKCVFKKWYDIKPSRFLKGMKNLMKGKFKKYNLKYPFAWGYSDILITPAEIMNEFTKYCGVFAAHRVFVELSVPTALLLTAHSIKTDNDTKLKGRAYWGKDIDKLNEELDFKSKEILKDFPRSQFYIHPVKLSKWDC